MQSLFFVFCLTILVNLRGCSAEIYDLTEFENLTFGVATSAYQVEGAWNEDGKGENRWDHITSAHPALIKDESNGRNACKSYELYHRDVQMLREIKAEFYKFSISWSRVLPHGYINKINEAGLDYYEDLLNELEKHDIEPYVTMFHWDLPRKLVGLGSFTNFEIIHVFKDYANLLFERFGDRVTNWITFDDPGYYCHIFADFENATEVTNIVGITDYLCAHNILLAHKEVYRLFEKEYKDKNNGSISINLATHWYEPHTASDADAQDRALEFNLGWFANAIFGEGNYPQVMRDRIKEVSGSHTFQRSRLPEFTEDEVNDIKNTADFFAINYYGSYTVKDMKNPPKQQWPTITEDVNIEVGHLSEWESTVSPQVYVHPEGLRKLLKYIKDKYGSTDIRVLGSGYPTASHEQNDTGRVKYIRDHIVQISDAIEEDGVNVTAYCYWSLMDNFAWEYGYTHKYGLYGVDFNDPNRTRSRRASAMAFRHIIATRTVDYDFLPAVGEQEEKKCSPIYINLANPLHISFKVLVLSMFIMLYGRILK